MNVIVVVVDTLRYDYIRANGNTWIKTPHLDRFAAQAWNFDRCFAGSYPTVPHRKDVLTGRCSIHGTPFNPWSPLPFDALTLPGLLAEAGYCTQLIHDTPHLVNGGHNFDWPFHAWTFVRGGEIDRPWIDDQGPDMEDWQRDGLFDCVDTQVLTARQKTFRTIMEHTTSLTYSRANRRRKKPEDWNCARLFRTASEWLRDNAGRDNFFLWVDCFDPHEPWDAPAELVKMYDDTPGYDGSIDPRSFGVVRTDGLPEAVTRRIRAQYAAKVTWADKWLGVFLDTLGETGLSSNTAVIVTADHGTNMGERNEFHKGYPVREQEGHIPLMIRVPDGDSGRSDAIVQPQDIFATVASLAGCSVPDGIESFDVLDMALRGEGGRRKVALSGSTATLELPGPDSEKTLFTVFSDDWYLILTAKPECSQLVRYGSTDNVAESHPEIVRQLHKAGIDELERRGTRPELVAWLRSGGETGLPAKCKFWERADAEFGPPGYRSYIWKIYDKD